jgi:hypothetical protein
MIISLHVWELINMKYCRKVCSREEHTYNADFMILHTSLASWIQISCFKSNHTIDIIAYSHKLIFFVFN